MQSSSLTLHSISAFFLLCELHPPAWRGKFPGKVNAVSNSREIEAITLLILIKYFYYYGGIIFYLWFKYNYFFKYFEEKCSPKLILKKTI